MLSAVWTGWVRPQIWPEMSPPGLVFLGRAFEQIGEMLFDDWHNGEVLVAEEPMPLRIPSAEQAYREGKPHYGFHKEYAEKVAALCPGISKDDIPEALWRAVSDDAEARIANIYRARDRRDHIVTVCAALARCGDLRFAWRRKGGGQPPRPIAPEEWEIDYPFLPFATLGYSEEQGLSSPMPTAWLFVTVESLQRVLAGESDATSEEGQHIDDAAMVNAASAVQALAAALDLARIPIRTVTKQTIAQRWDNANGPPPLVKSVTGHMKGAGKGGRPANEP